MRSILSTLIGPCSSEPLGAGLLAGADSDPVVGVGAADVVADGGVGAAVEL
jgi:hypothetical protein